MIGAKNDESTRKLRDFETQNLTEINGSMIGRQRVNSIFSSEAISGFSEKSVTQNEIEKKSKNDKNSKLIQDLLSKIKSKDEKISELKAQLRT